MCRVDGCCVRGVRGFGVGACRVRNRIYNAKIFAFTLGMRATVHGVCRIHYCLDLLLLLHN